MCLRNSSNFSQSAYESYKAPRVSRVLETTRDNVDRGGRPSNFNKGEGSPIFFIGVATYICMQPFLSHFLYSLSFISPFPPLFLSLS